MLEFILDLLCLRCLTISQMVMLIYHGKKNDHKEIQIIVWFMSSIHKYLFFTIVHDIIYFL